MLAKKHPFTCCPEAKHQNATNLALQPYEKKKQCMLFIAPHGCQSLAPKIILLT